MDQDQVMSDKIKSQNIKDLLGLDSLVTKEEEKDGE